MSLRIEFNRRSHELTQFQEIGGGEQGKKLQVEADPDMFGFTQGILYLDQPEAIFKRIETWQALRAQSDEFEPYLVKHYHLVTLPDMRDGTLGLLCSDLTEGKMMEITDHAELAYYQPPLFREAARWLNNSSRIREQSYVSSTEPSSVLDLAFEAKTLKLFQLLDDYGWQVMVDTFFFGVEKVNDPTWPYVRHIFLGDLGSHIRPAPRKPYQNLYGRVWDLISFGMYGEY